MKKTKIFEYEIGTHSTIDGWGCPIKVMVEAENDLDARSKIGHAISFLANNLEYVKCLINDGR